MEFSKLDGLLEIRAHQLGTEPSPLRRLARRISLRHDQVVEDPPWAFILDTTENRQRASFNLLGTLEHLQQEAPHLPDMPEVVIATEFLATIAEHAPEVQPSLGQYTRRCNTRPVGRTGGALSASLAAPCHQCVSPSRRSVSKKSISERSSVMRLR